MVCGCGFLAPVRSRSLVAPSYCVVYAWSWCFAAPACWSPAPSWARRLVSLMVFLVLPCLPSSRLWVIRRPRRCVEAAVRARRELECDTRSLLPHTCWKLFSLLAVSVSAFSRSPLSRPRVIPVPLQLVLQGFGSVFVLAELLVCCRRRSDAVAWASLLGSPSP